MKNIDVTRKNFLRFAVSVAGFAALAACGKEPPTGKPENEPIIDGAPDEFAEKEPVVEIVKEKSVEDVDPVAEGPAASEKDPSEKFSWEVTDEEVAEAIADADTSIADGADDLFFPKDGSVYDEDVNGHMDIDGVTDASTAVGVTEKEAVDAFRERGFEGDIVTYYDMDGTYLGHTVVDEPTDAAHPVYETLYVTSDPIRPLNVVIWKVYICNGYVEAVNVTQLADGDEPTTYTYNGFNAYGYNRDANEFVEFFTVDDEGDVNWEWMPNGVTAELLDYAGR